MDTHPDPKIMAVARVTEQVAVLAPQIRKHIADQYAELDGAVTEHPGANPERIVTPTKALDGYCTHNIPAGDVMIDCGLKRPCPEHDTPVKLTRTERAAAERQHLRHMLDDYEDRLKFVADLTRNLLIDGNRILKRRFTAEDEPVCVGYPVGKTCTDLAGYNMTSLGPILRSPKLCDACYIEAEADERMERAAAERRRYASQRSRR